MRLTVPSCGMPAPSTAETGIVTIEQAPAGALTLQSLAGTSPPTWSMRRWRIPSAPIRPGSLQITATPLTGGQLNVRADNDGKLSGGNVEGKIDYETGWCGYALAVATAAGNEVTGER